MRRLTQFLVGLSLLVPSFLWAQTPAPPMPEASSWQAIAAMAINGVGVAIALRVSQAVIPALESRVPWMMPALAAMYGPVLMQVQAFLSDMLGVAIDLAPLYGMASGATAFLFHAQRARVLATGGKWAARGIQGLKFGLVLLACSMLLVGCAQEIAIESPGCSASASAGGGAGGPGAGGEEPGSGADGGSSEAASGCTPGKVTTAQNKALGLMSPNKLTQ
jgi:hypothetical protein